MINGYRASALVPAAMKNKEGKELEAQKSDMTFSKTIQQLLAKCSVPLTTLPRLFSKGTTVISELLINP